jgi:Rps23 Pro-64 3,4-dihydroxylase Tpa1-like proline 4-hydroxylase
MELSLNPEVDFEQAKQTYLDTQKTRVPNLLPIKLAEEIAVKLANELDYVNAYYDEEKYHTISQQDLLNLNKEEQHALSERIYTNAARGIGYIFGRHSILIDEVRSQKSQFAQDILRWLNSQEIIEHVRQVTGNGNINKAMAQAMRLMPGHFITRHVDVLPEEQRLISFSLDFNINWHSDWGGLTVFFEKDGTTREAWTPKFNTLDLFDVKFINSTTYVTPYSPMPRLSINGWFCG